MSPGFPLFRLPDNVVLSVFQNVGVAQQILLSMISRKTKKIVCSLNLRPDSISLDTGASCDLKIQFGFVEIRIAFEKSDKNAEREFVKIERPERVEFYEKRCVKLRRESVAYGWVNGPAGVRDYIDHFMEILHHNWIDELTLAWNSAYPLESIQQLINGLEIKNLHFTKDSDSEDYLVNCLNAIKPSRSFYLNQAPLYVRNRTRMRQFFIQNLDDIFILDAPFLTLDDLLLMNISDIQINCTRMMLKHFNRFLKHWIAGSNPRLKYLWIGGRYTDDDREECERKLLNGIEHRKIPDEEKRTCVRHMGSYAEHMEPFSGGSYIRRKDGTEAIVLSQNHFFQLILQELVNV